MSSPLEGIGKNYDDLIKERLGLRTVNETIELGEEEER